MRLYTDLDRVMPSKLMVAALVLALAGCIVAKQEVGRFSYPIYPLLQSLFYDACLDSVEMADDHSQW